jgi:hypothetical protein
MTTGERVREQAVSIVASPFASDGETLSDYVRRTRPAKPGRVDILHHPLATARQMAAKAHLSDRPAPLPVRPPRRGHGPVGSVCHRRPERW